MTMHAEAAVGGSGEAASHEGTSLAVLTIRLIGRLRTHHVTRLAPVGLSLPEANALLHLHPGESMTMRRLADLMGFDKSNLTGVMAKLERRGLVARDDSMTDRRLRAMRLTDEGSALRRRIDADLTRDSPLLTGLSEAEQHDLNRLLLKLQLDDVPGSSE